VRFLGRMSLGGRVLVRLGAGGARMFRLGAVMMLGLRCVVEVGVGAVRRGGRVMLGVQLGGFGGVVGRVGAVARRHLGVVTRRRRVAGRVVRGGLAMMLRRLVVVIGGVGVMFVD
jgi:hypothetical protein